MNLLNAILLKPLTDKTCVILNFSIVFADNKIVLKHYDVWWLQVIFADSSDGLTIYLQYPASFYYHSFVQ